MAVHINNLSFQKSSMFSAIFTDPSTLAVVQQMLTAIYRSPASIVNSQMFTAFRQLAAI